MRRLTILAIILAACSQAAEVQVNVDASRVIVLGDQAKVDANLFGITAFEGFPAVVADRDYRSMVQALRPGCFRFGGGISWFAPPEYDPEWFDTQAAATMFEQTLLFGNKYPFGRFLPVVREMGAEPMLSLGGPPTYLTQEGTNNPSDFGKWAQYCARYVGLWKRFDPNFRLVQIWNEPNASWFRDPRANDRGTSAASLHIEMANNVARAIKARYPDIQIGGPVLCWPPGWPPSQVGQKPWYTWQGWTLPWLEGTRDTVDFFDFHVYDVSPGDLQVQTEMTYNQALLTQGRKLPIWITESNTNLNPEELNDPRAIWEKRFLPYQRLLLRGVLPQADKVAGNLYHDLHAKNHTLLPRGAFDPDPMYWLLWILRDLRGWRLIADSADESVVAFATAEDDRVSVVLFNDSPEEAIVRLSVRMPTGYATGPHMRAVGMTEAGVPGRIQVDSSFERTGAQPLGTVTLPRYATACVSFLMQNFVRPSAAVEYAEHFGDATVRFLDTGDPADFVVRVPDGEVESAWLRVGLLGPQATDRLAATLNGQKLALESVAMQDILLEPGQLAAENPVRINLEAPTDNPRLAVGFVSIITRRTATVSAG
ncbi:MAG: glycosyl hydrolase [Acidobacteriota bacterium]|nr:glycosyl hydrolase [Acidobacteriota bacterium]